MPPDYAARAANDDTIGPDDFPEGDADTVATAERVHPGTGEPGTPVPMTVNPDGTATGEIQGETVVITDEEVESLRRQVKSLQTELDQFRERRSHEQELLSERDAAMHAIESAKNQVAAEKQNLAKVEEEIAALLRSPMPIPWNDTPIGQMAADRDAPALPKDVAQEAPPAWSAELPPVDPSLVRLAENEPNAPTLDAIAGLVCMGSVMEGEKRKPPTVVLYDRPYLVSHAWSGDSASRFNCIPLFTKDEWAQLYEDDFGRAVADFDQSDEAKARRQEGGPWCGLVVKIGRTTHVVGPQVVAMQLVYEVAVPESADDTDSDAPDDTNADE